MRAKNPHLLGPYPRRYRQLVAQLARAGWCCHGTVVSRSLRRKVGGRWVAKGPYYLWTAKQQGKTVCHALSPTQYAAAKSAIAANRKVMATLSKLQSMTLDKILNHLPGVRKRK